MAFVFEKKCKLVMLTHFKIKSNMKYDELGIKAKSHALYNEIKFQILTEDRPDAIAFNGQIDKLYSKHKPFFEECCRQDEFNINGVIIKPKS